MGTHGFSCLMRSVNISEQGMAEGEDKVLAKDTGGEEEARGAPGAPVSAGPCSLLAWPLGNLASLLTGVPHLPDGTHFRPPPAKPFGEPLDHVRTCLDPSGASSLHTWPFSTSTEAPMGMVTLHLVLPPPYPGLGYGLSCSDSNHSKSTRNCQPCPKCAMTLFGRQSGWFAPPFLRLHTVGGLPIIRSQLLPPLLKLPSPIWFGYC